LGLKFKELSRILGFLLALNDFPLIELVVVLEWESCEREQAWEIVEGGVPIVAFLLVAKKTLTTASIKALVNGHFQ